ncbi:hypothetical protein [Vibrio comitans]|nr:hypothetical protein [Vibrio comitans]
MSLLIVVLLLLLWSPTRNFLIGFLSPFIFFIVVFLAALLFG